MLQAIYTNLVFDVENLAAYHFGMTLKREFDRLGITPTSAAKATGMPQPVIQRWYKGTRPITKSGAEKLAPLVDRTPQYLLFAGRTVEIVGKAGAAATINYFGESSGNIGRARFPDHGSSKTVAVEIDGDSLGSGFNGWIAYYDHRHEPPTPGLIRKLCVVAIDEGQQVLIKRLMPGGSPDVYDLLPGGGVGDPIPDQRVIWAAEVTGLVPGSIAKIEESQDLDTQGRAIRRKKRQASTKRRR